MKADDKSSYSVRNERGALVERLERRLDGSYVRRDPSGTRQGAAEPAFGGSFVLHDSKGALK